MKESDMARIAAWLVDALRRPDSSSRLSAEVQDCAAAFPCQVLYAESCRFLRIVGRSRVWRTCRRGKSTPGFICGDHTTLLVDTGASALAAATLHGYATLARPGNRLLVINTERHSTTSAATRFSVSCGAAIPSATPPACGRRRSFAPRWRSSRRDSRPGAARAREAEVFYRGTSLAVPNQFVTEDTALDLGGLEVQVFLTPGHTPSNLAVYVPAEGVLYSGDCLVNSYLPNLACGAAPEWHQWLDSIARHRAAGAPGRRSRPRPRGVRARRAGHD